MELEAKVDSMLFDGVTTSDVQENIIHHAKTLANKENPDWIFVAGRAQTLNRWNTTKAYEKPFEVFVQDMINSGKYDAKMINKFSQEEIKDLGKLIIKENDLAYSISAVINAEHKYLLEGECLQQMHLMNAMSNANVESDETRFHYAKKFFISLTARKTSLATPWLGNLRTGGNISSCFIYETGDSRDSIADNIKRVIDTSAAGGGMGMSLAKIRAAGSSIAGNEGASKGVMSYIKVLNDLAVWIDQGGKRSGAITVALPIWHRDIEAFLEIQDKNKDPRTQSFDVFMQVGMFDKFMECAEKGDPWYTFCPFEVKTKLGIDLSEMFCEEFEEAYNKCVEAHSKGLITNVKIFDKPKDLPKKFMKKWVTVGTPYVAMMDTINRYNPNKHMGVIPCVNLCCESFSVVKDSEFAHSCNLGSIVAGRLNNYDDFLEEARIVTRMLSNGLLITNSPSEVAKNHNNLFATIGVGVMGLHDYLIKIGSDYSDEYTITKIFEYVQYGAMLESIQLAKERGAFKAFKGSDWDNGKRVAEFKRLSVSSELDYDYIQSMIDQYGIHNSQLTSPAPNTSTSLLMDASAGVFPVYAPFFLDDNIVGATPVAGMYLKSFPKEYENSQVKHIQSELAISASWMQKFVDTGISTEYIYSRADPTLNAKVLWNLVETVWKTGGKAIYYVRSQKREVACESCEA